MADLDKAPNRKRRAASYMTKDSVEDGNSSSDEGTTEMKTFRRADPATIAAREITTVRRRGVGSASATKEAMGSMLGVNTNPEPPAELVPKPTVSNWKPVALNFSKAKKEDTTAPESGAAVGEEEKTKDVSTDTKAAAVPKAFSTKPFAFSSQFGKPPMPNTEASESGKANDDVPSPSKTTPAPTLSTKTSKPTEVAPLTSSGFKFTANTKWSFGKTTPLVAPTATGDVNGTGDGEKNEAGTSPAPAKRTWNFMNNVKPAPLSSHFPAPGAASSETSGVKPGFQFGKNVAAAKATEPSKEVLKDLATSKDDSASKLQDRAPVKTITGEEQEDTLFTADAKLFEMDTVEKKWIERGVGVFRINRLKTDPTRLRLLMHIKTTLKLILNSPIYPGMIVMPLDKQPTCVKLTAIPIPAPPPSSSSESSSDANPTETTTNEPPKEEKKQPSISVFNLRFRDAETAAKALKEAQDAIKSLSSSTDLNKDNTTQASSDTKKDPNPVPSPADSSQKNGSSETHQVEATSS